MNRLRGLWQGLKQGPALWQAYRQTKSLEKTVEKQLMEMAIANHELLKDPRKATNMMADNELKQFEEAMTAYVQATVAQSQGNPAEDLEKISNAKLLNQTVASLMQENKRAPKSKELQAIEAEILKSDAQLAACRTELNAELNDAKTKSMEELAKLKASTANLFTTPSPVEGSVQQESPDEALARIKKAKGAVLMMNMGDATPSLLRLLDEGEQALAEIAAKREKEAQGEDDWEHLSKEEAAELEALIAETSKNFLKISSMKASIADQRKAQQVDMKERLEQAKAQAKAQAAADLAMIREEQEESGAVNDPTAPVRAMADVFRGMVEDGAEVEGTVLSEEERETYRGIYVAIGSLQAEEMTALEEELSKSIDLETASPAVLLKGMGDILLRDGKMAR